LRYVGIVADISFFIGVFVTPLFSGFPEKCHVEHIGFVGIHETYLLWRKILRKQVFLYGIGVYAVIYFCELSFNIPIQFFCLLAFKVLKLFNQVEFKFNRNP
jgi:hypothetical protein